MKTLPSNINGYATTKRLGNAVSFSYGFMGNMDGVRYIKGIARYFGDFTPDVTIPLAIAK